LDEIGNFGRTKNDILDSMFVQCLTLSNVELIQVKLGRLNQEYLVTFAATQLTFLTHRELCHTMQQIHTTVHEEI